MIILMWEFRYGGNCSLKWALWESEYPPDKQSLGQWESWSWRSRWLRFWPWGTKPGSATQVSLASAGRLSACLDKLQELAPNKYQSSWAFRVRLFHFQIKRNKESGGKSRALLSTKSPSRFLREIDVKGTAVKWYCFSLSFPSPSCFLPAA